MLVADGIKDVLPSAGNAPDVALLEMGASHFQMEVGSLIGDGQKWVYYTDLNAFAIDEQPAAKRGKNFQLSHWFNTYDWTANDGFNNFSSWIE